MNKHYSLIARAVERLDKSNGEARRVVYERARTAVAQLGSNQPALLDADITKECLALEEAIRQVEAEAARNSLRETRAEPRSPVPSEGTSDVEKIQSGQVVSPDRDDPPQALSSRQAPTFLPAASDDRHKTDIEAVAIGGAYGADHYYDDILSSRSRGGLLVVAAMLALAALTGTFAYRAMFRGEMFLALRSIVKTGSAPDKIVGNNSNSQLSNSSQTFIASAGSSEELQPIDTRESSKSVPRVISTIPISSKPSAEAVALAPDTPAPEPAVVDPHVAPSAPLASSPVPVPASSEATETAAVAPAAREEGAPSPASAAPVLTAASVPPPAAAPMPAQASSDPKKVELVRVAPEIPASTVMAAPVTLPNPAAIQQQLDQSPTAAALPSLNDRRTQESEPPPYGESGERQSRIATVVTDPVANANAIMSATVSSPSVSQLERTRTQPDDEEIAALIKRGQDFVRNHDFSSARLLLKRAAEAGSAAAALSLGETFDPLVLQQFHEIGVQPDLAQARDWYERAARLGSDAASQRLAKIAPPPQ
jgi:hypothetical protein